VTVVPNGVARIDRPPETRGRIRRELDIDEETFVFLAVGNARPEKDFMNLMEAADRLRSDSDAPPFVVLIAGGMQESDYTALLGRRHEELGLGTVVRFLGFREDAAALYAAADERGTADGDPGGDDRGTSRRRHARGRRA
jgi:glycosyltransferase involved in cell wall biosynthesis